MKDRQDWQKRAYVKRATVSDEEAKEQTSLFGNFLTERLASSVKELDQTVVKTTAPLDSGIVKEDRRRYLEVWARNESLLPIRPLNFTLQPGNRIIGPPYDSEWSVGSGIIGAWTAKDDGKLMTLSMDGFSASGIGIVLDGPVELAVAVTPLGNSQFFWISASPDPNVRSKGGVGIVVYELGDGSPLVERQATLWSVVGTSALQGGSGGGPIADAVAGSTAFGDILLAPALFNMYPGKRYLVWVWLWQTFASRGDDSFICFHNAEVPAIVTSAGPPIIIH
jgi:hypothetical protein